MATLTAYRYTLDPSSRKFRCPSCERKRFVLYIDNETGNYQPDDIGRCDREIECGYHKKPREADGIELGKVLYSRPESPKEPKVSTLPYKYVKASMGRYSENTLIQWLATLPGWDQHRAEFVARLYRVGTGSKDVHGWSIFWQIDEQAKVRSGKLMKYHNGHRVKLGYSQDWIHSRINNAGQMENFELVQCLYGLHIVDETKPLAIVESEKTAIICSQYLPVFHWLAAGQLHGINEYKLRPLRGRAITLFPDIGAFDLWQEKAEECSHIGNIQVSDLLERKASNEDRGYDLADYLIRFDLEVFQRGENGESEAPTKHIFSKAEAPYGFNPYTGEIFDERGYPASWDKIEMLEPGTPQR